MKKVISTLGLLVGLAGVAQAQRSDVSLGLKTGGTLSNFAGADASAYQNLFGFQVGIFANIGISKMVAFQPEVLYSQKGAKAPLVGGSTYTRHLNYVDVPLAFHVNADGLFFEVGPQLGVLVAATDELGSASANVKDQFNAIDFGYLAGLGYQHKTGLGAGLRYNGGFNNVRKAVTLGNITIQERSRNSAFQLYLTYSFGG